MDIETGQVLGVECLCRFTDEPRRSPDVWFKEAAACDLGIALEIATLRKALAASAGFPRGMYVSVNASPELAISGQLPAVLAAFPGRRILVEFTEHSRVDDYTTFNAAIMVLRRRGYEIAVDDAGRAIPASSTSSS